MKKSLLLIFMLSLGFSCSTEDASTEELDRRFVVPINGSWRMSFRGTLCYTQSGKFFNELPTPEWISSEDRCFTGIWQLPPGKDSLYCHNQTVYIQHGSEDQRNLDGPYNQSNDNFGAIFKQHILDRETWMFKEGRVLEIERLGREPVSYECQNDTVISTTSPGFSVYNFVGTWSLDQLKLMLTMNDTLHHFHLDSLSDSLLWVTPMRNPHNHTFQLIKLK